MNYRFFTLLVGALLSLTSFTLNAQGFSVVIDSVTAQPGQIICIPIRAKGFLDIVSFQYTLKWQKQVISFDHTQLYSLPGLSAQDFLLNFSKDCLVVTWADPSGNCLSKLDNEILYEVCFLAIGPPGSNTSVTEGSCFAPSAPGAEAYNCQSQNVWNQVDTGFVEISLQSGTSNFSIKDRPLLSLSPNPTTFGTTLIYQSPDATVAYILISDVLGRTVFEHTFDLAPGENRFEIPANAVNNKGIYQVSLHTKGEVRSLLLSVQ